MRALRLWPWLAAIASGFFCAACFAPFSQTWLCWIALTPLLTAIWFSGGNSKRRWLRDLLLGYVAGLAFFWTVFFWLRTVTVPGWVLVGFYMAIYFAAWSWLCGRLRPFALLPAPVIAPEREATLQPNESLPNPSPWLRSTKNLSLAFLVASAWVTQEMLRSLVLTGWGWNSLGSALHGQIAMIQITEFTGVAGLSFVVVFTNVIVLATVRRFILEIHARPIRPHYDLTLTMVALVGVMAYGLHALQIHRPANKLRVAAIQANIPREHKFNREFAETIFNQFTRLSEIAVRPESPPDLLVWPESSMPGPVLQDAASNQFVMEFSAAVKTDLLLGTIQLEEERAYNAALLVSDGGQRVQIYRKVHLVPFGEYVPGRHIMPLLAKIVGDQVPDDFAFGTEHTVFHLTDEKARVAPLICFEDTIGELTRQFVLGGANLLANVTNDGWFLRSAGSQQHLDNAVFRCVETRRPMVRAANTGVTCFVSEFGRITQRLVDDTGSHFTEGVLISELAIPTGPERTFYVQHGELFADGCVGVTVIALLGCFIQFVRRR
ncbi:MAG: apolipoprotein N-acyltransferase [Verrucomicrobiota bacterium]